MNRQFQQVGFELLSGWEDDDHLTAMDVFLRTARHMLEQPYHSKELGIKSRHLLTVCERAVQHALFNAESAKLFFEKNFTPCELLDESRDQIIGGGFVTAYYEPEVLASRVRSAEFSAPLFARPDDLFDVTKDNTPVGWNIDYRFAKRNVAENGEFLEIYPDRKAINNGYLDGKGLEIAYVKTAADALFIHIQGSARLRFEDGKISRVGYAAKTGHPYTAVGKVLLDSGELSRKDCGMQAIRNWFSSNPERMTSVIEQNRSYIFFQEYPVADLNEGPVGASKVALTAERSLAIDRTLHTYGTPIWIETQKPLPGHNQVFQKLMVAQDTGSAIIGPERGDIFLGSGDGPGEIAGDTRHRARFVVFVPKL